MIEVDVFWSFSFGAVFAAVAYEELCRKSLKDWTLTKSFRDTLLFLSLFFGPSGIYLLWAFPGWESMFILGDKNLIDASLVTAFSVSNILLGIVGFFLTASAIKTAKNFSFHLYWIYSYLFFDAILGLGYARFTYAGNWKDWQAGRKFPISAFLTSPVFYALLSMAAVMVPWVIMIVSQTIGKSVVKMGKDFKMPVNQVKSELVKYVIKHWMYGFLLVNIGYFCFISFQTPVNQAYFSHGPPGIYAPLIGFAIAHWGVLSIISFFAISSSLIAA